MRRRVLVTSVLALTSVLTAAVLPARSEAQSSTKDDSEASLAATRRVTVGSKNFAENRLLGEIFAQLLEARTNIDVERRFGLAGTEFCFQALRGGSIDLYPEYTGTGWVTLLGQPITGSASETLRGLRREFLERWNLWWLSPLGFENAYEIAVPRALAERLSLSTISDLAKVSSGLRAGLGYEFVEREDGLPGLRETYGLELASVQAMLQAPKYQAASSGALDVLDVYTTDGQLLVHDLVVLEDDRDFFPPYEAAALVNGETLERLPEIGAVLGLLAGALDVDTMRALNLRLERDKEPLERVAADALADLGLVGGGPSRVVDRNLERPGILAYFWQQRAYLARLTGQHLFLAAIALGLGVLVALPMALALERSARGWAENAIRAVGTTQTIPSLALLGFLIPILGVGVVPSIVALWIYSIFPILRSSYSGIRDADPTAVEAATALGMTPVQVLRHVRLPLAAPSIMAGIRTSAILSIGTATLAAFIGAGGLGEPIISGVQLVDSRRILLGAIPAALLALAVDALLGRVEVWLRPTGID